MLLESVTLFWLDIGLTSIGSKITITTNNSSMSRGRNKNSRIYVCQSGTCRSKGSDAALVEIEELAKLVGNCDGVTGGSSYPTKRIPASFGLQRKPRTPAKSSERGEAVFLV